MSDTIAETVETVATHLAADGKSITVWVKGDTGATPRQGNALCARVAVLLRQETGATDVVYDPDESEMFCHDTVVYTMDPHPTEEDWWPVLAALGGGRTVQPNVIIHANAVPKDLQTLIDIRATAPESGGIGSIVRLRTDNTTASRTIREEELAGLIGGA